MDHEPTRQLMNTLRRSGRVLGIDVGYSRRSRTTGLCCLRWDTEEIDWRCERAGTADASRLAALERLDLGEEKRVDAVAIDGPLRPGLEYRVAYRAAEAALSRGKLRLRGKPGPTNGGSGPELHRAATDLARLSVQNLRVRRGHSRVSVGPTAVVEAFPNLFLGVLCDEADYPTRPIVSRRWTDTLFPIVKPRLCQMLSCLLPRRRLLGDMDLDHHEDVAALACAMTALCVAAGRFEAVGSVDDGFIVLPPLRFWGSSRSDPDAWARIEVDRALALARGRFPKIESWHP